MDTRMRTDDLAFNQNIDSNRPEDDSQQGFEIDKTFPPSMVITPSKGKMSGRVALKEIHANTPPPKSLFENHGNKAGKQQATPILRKSRRLSMNKRVSFGGEQIKLIMAQDPRNNSPVDSELREPTDTEDNPTVTFSSLGLPQVFVDEDVNRGIAAPRLSMFAAGDMTETINLGTNFLRDGAKFSNAPNLQDDETAELTAHSDDGMEITQDFAAKLKNANPHFASGMGSRLLSGKSSGPENDFYERRESVGSPGDITMSIPSLQDLVEDEDAATLANTTRKVPEKELGGIIGKKDSGLMLSSSEDITETNTHNSDEDHENRMGRKSLDDSDSFDRMYGQVFGNDPTEDDLNFDADAKIGDVTAALPSLAALLEKDEHWSASAKHSKELPNNKRERSSIEFSDDENTQDIGANNKPASSTKQGSGGKKQYKPRTSDITGTIPSLLSLIEDASAELSPILKEGNSPDVVDYTGDTGDDLTSELHGESMVLPSSVFKVVDEVEQEADDDTMKTSATATMTRDEKSTTVMDITVEALGVDEILSEEPKHAAGGTKQGKTGSDDALDVVLAAKSVSMAAAASIPGPIPVASQKESNKNRRKSILANVRRLSVAQPLLPSMRDSMLAELGDMTTSIVPTAAVVTTAVSEPKKASVLDILGTLEVVEAGFGAKALENDVARSATATEDEAASMAVLTTQDPATPAYNFEDFLHACNVRFLDNVSEQNREASFGGTIPETESNGLSDISNESALQSRLGTRLKVRPTLSIFQSACSELDSQIQSLNKQIAKQVEQLEQSQPAVFVRLTSKRHELSKDDLSSIQVSLRRLKNFCRLESKKVWHEWRGQFESACIASMEQSSLQLLNDCDFVSNTSTELKQMIGELQVASKDLNFEYDLGCSVDDDELVQKNVEMQNEVLRLVSECKTTYQASEPLRSVIHSTQQDIAQNDLEIKNLITQCESIRQVLDAESQGVESLRNIEEHVKLVSQLTEVDIVEYGLAKIALVVGSNLDVNVRHGGGKIEDIVISCSRDNGMDDACNQAYSSYLTSYALAHVKDVRQLPALILTLRRHHKLFSELMTNTQSMVDMQHGSVCASLIHGALHIQSQVYVSSLSSHTKLAVNVDQRIGSLKDVGGETPVVESTTVSSIIPVIVPIGTAMNEFHSKCLDAIQEVNQSGESDGLNVGGVISLLVNKLAIRIP